MTVPNTQRVTRYLFVFVRWLLVLGAVFALTLFAGLYVINNVLEKVYQARAIIELPAGDLMTPSAPAATPEPEPLQPEFENTMMSPEFLLAVVKDLGLEKEWAKRLYKSDQDELPDVDALTRMENLVRIEVKRGTHVVEITASSDVPQEAADIANAVADRYQATRDVDSTANPIRILQRAQAPTEPSKPRRRFDFFLTLALAGIAGVLVASFVEMVFLFMRAGERMEN